MNMGVNVQISQPDKPLRNLKGPQRVGLWKQAVSGEPSIKFGSLKPQTVKVFIGYAFRVLVEVPVTWF